jgi:threonine/homoserine/homoserine lactone efflux protein
MLLYIIQGIGYGFAAAVQPGPFQTYVISQALNTGWRRALPVSRVPDWFQRVLYVAGGLFILYLARNAFVGWRDFRALKAEELASGRQNLLRAAMMNALSPGPYIFWSLVTGPILLAGWREASGNGVGFLAGFYLAMIASLGAIILVFATARRLGPRVNRALLGVSALALLGFGLYQLARGALGVGL